MGAWGYGVWENDRALDWVTNVERFVRDHLTRSALHGNQARYEDWRASVRLLSMVWKETGSFDEATRDTAAARLGEILSDDEWLLAWDRPGAIRREIEEELKYLTNLK